jgi:hypothetical protein
MDAEAWLDRHRAVRTDDPPALIRADQIMIAERDLAAVPDGLTRWLADPHPAAAGVHRWPLRPGTGADVRALLADLGDRDRHRSAAPVHLLHAAPRWRGGPADDAVVIADAPAPAPSDPDAPPVTVAVLDTGITAHPWFADRSWWTEVTADQLEVPDPDGDGQVGREVGHGTFVVGVLLRHAPSARVVVQRLLSPDGVCDEVQLIEGLAALRRRTVLVAAAGNDATERPFWPAALKNVIAVGALDATGTGRAAFSNCAWWVEACAIGQDVRSAFPLPDGTAGFARWSGTSFATPVITGTIAHTAAQQRIDAATAADLVLSPTGRAEPGLGTVIG